MNAQTDQSSLRVLIADDNRLDADLAIQELEQDGIRLESHSVTTKDEFQTAVMEFAPDVILCDFSFPDFDGLEALSIVKALGVDAPFIFVTGSLTEERAVVAVKNGAVDYVLKSSLVRLPNAVRHAVAEAKERRGRLEAQQKNEHLHRIRHVMAAVNSVILRLPDAADLFREACRIASTIGSFSYSAIVTINQQADCFELRAGAGFDEAAMTASFTDRRVSVPKYEFGVLDESLRTLRPATVNDLAAAELPVDYKDLFAQRGLRSIGSFPLVLDGRAIGAVLLGTPEPNFFDAEEIMLVAGLTGNLTFALDLIDKQQRADYLSYYDPLTDLPNRTLLREKLVQELAVARRSKTMTALVIIDVVRFSAINNTFGEHVGDELLRGIATRLRTTLPQAQISRIVNDRFALLLPGLGDLHSITDLLTEDGVPLFNRPFFVHGQDMHVTVKAGCAIFPNDGNDAEAIFRSAEAALRNAKSGGRAFQFYSAAMTDRLAERLDLEFRLHKAMDEGQFVLYYQPKVDLISQKIVSVEALIRWNDPARGLVPPGDFIPLLEQTGMIINVGRWALGEAARQYEAWKEAGLEAPRIAVNLSTLQLRQEALVDEVSAVVAIFRNECGLDIEITESMLMENFSEAIAKLKQIQALGVELSLDDFGTGYSSLAYIHSLPISAMKIDRTFVIGMTEDANKMSIISTIISLAQALKLKVIAEGVETEEQARLLQLLRCDQIQGYLVGRPMPANEMIARLVVA